jgi:hypothetical protein
MKMLTDQQLEHFLKWANRHVRPEEHLFVFDRILALLQNYPELINDHSWSELRDMARAW